MKNFKYYLPGTLLISLAFLVIALPEILVAFVAAFIIMAGIGMLFMGHQMKKLQRHNRSEHFCDNGAFHRMWHRNFY